MSYHLQAEGLSKTYRVPVRRAGLGAAFGSLFRPEYDEVKAADGVSFAVERGERVGFIGPNGAGKTTTLKMLSGLLYPTAGTATAAGYSPPWKRKPAYLKKITLLMGNRSQLQWNNTVYDTLCMYKEIFGVPAVDFKKHVDALSELFDTGKLLQKRARNLSLGERMKCEFMLSLLHTPEILYLDEPTLGLDVTMQLRLRQYIKEYNERYGATVLLTSHYMSDIVYLCPRVLLINNGRLLYDGTLSGLTERLTPYRLITLTAEDGTPPPEQARLDALDIPAEVTSREGNTFTLRVAKADAARACAVLLREHALIDFSVADPPLEAVMDKIYAGVGV